jgi:hypothetical protein
MAKQRDRNVTLLGPVLLVAVGIILLMNTLGVLEWSIWWSLLRLWPVLLIAAGLDLLIGRRSTWGALLVAALTLAFLAGALWLIVNEGGLGQASAQNIRQPLGEVTQADVAFNPAVGVLRVEALPESADLVRGTVPADDGLQVEQEFAQQGDQATYSLTTSGEAWVPTPGGWDQDQLWELGLSPAPSLRLWTNMGAGETDLDLRGLNLSQLEVDNGLGFTKVVLPSQTSYRASIEQAIGSITVVIPQDLAVRITADTALAGRNLPAGLVQEGENVYTSPGYATASDQADVSLSLPIGLLTVRYEE